MESQSEKLWDQNYKLRPQNYKLRPQNYKLRSQNYKLRPQNYKLRSQNYKLRPQNYKLRVQNLQVWQLKLISYNFLKRCFECTVNGSLQMVVNLIAAFSQENKINFVFIFRLYFVVVNIKYLVSLYPSLRSYNKQFTSWLVRLCDFYYSLVVNGR